MADIQSTLIPLELSDNGTTWRTLVCLTQYNIPLSTTVNSTETFCGVSTGVGAVTFNPSGTAVCKADPTTNEWTLKELAIRMLAGQTIYFRAAYPAGGSVSGPVFFKGQCLITALDYQAQVGQAIQFTFTLTGTGTIDVEYP